MDVVSEGHTDAALRRRMWRWRFLDNPVGDVLIELAWDGEELAGQYAAMPIRMRVDGVPVTWAISLDTATHPDYRRQGIFTGLARGLYERMEAGVDVVFGFPNEQSSWAFYNRLEWVPVRPTPSMVLPEGVPLRGGMGRQVVALASQGLTSAMRRAHHGLARRVAAGVAGVSVEVGGAVPDGVDAFWDAICEQPGVRVETDGAWLRWRYEAHPTSRYRFVAARRGGTLVGLAVVRPPQSERGEGIGHVLEILSVDGAALKTALIAAAMRELARAGARRVYTLAPPASQTRHVLLGLGFVPFVYTKPNWEFTLGARQLGGHLSLARLFDAREWHVYYGVHDVF